MTALARSNFRSLRTHWRSDHNPPIGKGELQIDPAAAAEVELPVSIGPPPKDKGAGSTENK